MVPEKPELRYIGYEGKGTFLKRLVSFDTDQLRLSYGIHTHLYKSSGIEILAGTIISVLCAAAFRHYPQNEVLNLVEIAGMFGGGTIGSLAVYQRSACREALHLIEHEIHSRIS